MSSSIFAGLGLVLYAAIAFVLVQKYRRTHDVGFVWLGVAVIVWPMAANAVDRAERAAIDRLIRHQPIGFYPFTLVERGATTVGSLVYGLAMAKQLVGLVLLLVAVAYLCRGGRRRAV